MQHSMGFSYQASQTAVIKLPGIASTGQTGTEWNFDNLPYLDPGEAIIKGVSSFCVTSITNAPLAGTALVSAAIFQKSYLTLYGNAWCNGRPGKQGNQIYQNIPLPMMNPLQDSAITPSNRNWGAFCTGDMEVDWQKSLAKIANAPANTTDMVFLFEIFFDFYADRVRYEINPQTGVADKTKPYLIQV
jgi:hypothetical protein